MRVPKIALTLTIAAAAVSCTEAPTAPDGLDGPSFSVVDGGPVFKGAAAKNHFVVFGGRGMPRDFEAMVADVGGNVEGMYPLVGAAVVSGLEGRAARELKRSTGARYVELEPVLTLEEPAALSAPMISDGMVASPEDPTAAGFYPAQWNLQVIQADAAWAAGRLGDPGTTVAILDTGIDYLHQDLYGRVDLSRSVSFIPEDDALAAAEFPDRHPITDLRYHGTHVAATVSSNAVGAAGVTSGVTLVGVKVCDVTGSCPGSAVFQGIFHAIAIGAEVANMSLGGGFSKREFPGFVSVVQQLFNLANQQGVTMVVAAGNSAIDLDRDGNGFATYCNAANVVCVAATSPTSGEFFGPFPDVDSPAAYTNFGRSAISVAAPGGGGAWVIGACSSSSLVIPGCQAAPNFYIGAAGTSMASPHAAGVAALISEDVGRNPGAISQRLHQTADDVGAPGTDAYSGKGRINAGTAVGGS